MSETTEGNNLAVNTARKAPPSLLKTLLSKGHSANDALTHDGNNASIILDDKTSRETPWTPKSLGRAKTAIIYKQTLNDTLLVLERNMFFISGWVPYFVSLQEDSILMFTSRERWEQGLKPDKVIDLHHLMLLGDMKVDVIEGSSSLHDQDGNLRLFRRKLLETDELDEWLNEELRQSLVVSSGSKVDTLAVNNPNASTHCILEFGSYNQSTFELWSKAIRHILTTKREAHVNSLRSNQTREDTNSNSVATDGFAASQKCWVSPGQDSRVTLLQSEIWCNRVLSGEKEKAESEFRRIVAMEKLVAQVTHPQMALLVYEKVSRVHELFSANCRREIERLDGRETPMPTETLNFFADHLKRKYSVFLILALAYGVEEEEIREAHERMCQENAAVNAGVGGGIGEQQRPGASYGFEDPESLELYEKYRDAAFNYHKMNYGDTAAAEEEDAIMHLPVMLQVAIVRHDHEESTAMLSILNTVKARLLEHCTQENDS
ncbi:hypothetical protein, variant 1 [Phytophthora nicotianae CJ01A1]|uniref:PH domain-containing protein n=12 Tax=Phytophthora nicotianae TaxID=4792 RepID=W2R015_PHYN3|nr:hypothetical protein, variant 1 [Phytophthora nicotianae INRA-310]ETI33954.1 hypothetical protein, variant 1 [Phytophthora nicotianae P1569]ETK74318.1 hypothetical protein, variant 1 [Phytophthora nicotianae]ETO62754.1 hypothetical protein, variant 1 [Phytophthora nicotianae P1976]ETP03847.1 hypothetical protein, variant 1 [Phytophthora nicotianae CJ01A1]ETP31999.1 hypothetical protein, variant 1 [Phytophthora nicotianae P10297]